MYAIKTEKLTKYYGKARGITEVDLKVKEGDFFGFIGPNGAGKAPPYAPCSVLSEQARAMPRYSARIS